MRQTFSKSICNWNLFICLVIFLGCSSNDTMQPAPVQQQFGNLNGLILDNQGKTYGNVELKLEQSGNEIQNSTSDVNGQYQINNIPIGNYQINMQLPLGSVASGSNSADVVITDGTTSSQDFTFIPTAVDALIVSGSVDVLNEMMNLSRTEPTGAAEELYTPSSVSDPNSNLVAILAPDGHHVTLGEWNQAKGSAIVSCEGSITKYSLQFTGLIPNGVYTIWNFVMNKKLNPGNSLDFGTDFLGAGALKDGNSNIIVASANGVGALDVEAQPGALSMFGSQPNCVITNAPGLILVVNYHIDGNTYGATPGPDNADVAHMLIYF